MSEPEQSVDVEDGDLIPGRVLVRGFVKLLPVDALTLMACDQLLDGFSIQGFTSYLLGAVGLALPTFFTLAGLRDVNYKIDDWRDGPSNGRRVDRYSLLMVVVGIPIAVAGWFTGLLLAEWFAPDVQIDGGWTYFWASVLSATIFFALYPRSASPDARLR